MAGGFRLAAALVAVVASVAGSGVAAAQEAEGVAGRFDRPREAFAPPNTQLRPGPPESVGLDPAPIAAADEAVRAWTRPDPVTRRPLFAGAVTLLVHDGVIVHHTTAGQAVRYADAAGTELPADRQVPMRPDTIFDLASVSKLFTSLAVMRLVEDGAVRIEDPVAAHVPEFAAGGKEAITVEQLLTHTSGLEPFIPLWRDWPDRESRIKAVLERKPTRVPGTAYVYSDLNLIALGVLVERVGGLPLDRFVAERITEPLGMVDTGYNPRPEVLDRVAATEYQATPARGMVRGQVHDENAWSLGGVAGHAGMFSTARDLAVLGQAILNGGTYAGRRVLAPETVRMMLTNYNQEFPANAHGLGFDLDQRWYMGGLSGPRTAGHTGFTGTSLVLDPASRSIAILLTNRVHPSRSWGSINHAREAVATGLAKAMAVPPRHGDTSWHTGAGNATTATLTTPRLRAGGPVRVGFDAFVDTEATDPLVLEWSADDGVTWQPTLVLAEGRGAPEGEQARLAGAGHRSWWRVHADIPSVDFVTIRLRFTTDSRYTGRGINVDRLTVTQGDEMLLKGEKEPHLMRPVGWTEQTR